MNVMWLLNRKNIIGRELGSFIVSLSLQSASKLLNSDSVTAFLRFENLFCVTCLCLLKIFLFLIDVLCEYIRLFVCAV